MNDHVGLFFFLGGVVKDCISIGEEGLVVVPFFLQSQQLRKSTDSWIWVYYVIKFYNDCHNNEASDCNKGVLNIVPPRKGRNDLVFRLLL